jgi:hypothetical protein
MGNSDALSVDALHRLQPAGLHTQREGTVNAARRDVLAQRTRGETQPTPIAASGKHRTRTAAVEAFELFGIDGQIDDECRNGRIRQRFHRTHELPPATPI